MKRGRKKGVEKTLGSGRKVGTPNANTRILKDALLLAAEIYGSDGKGAGALVGFLLNTIVEDRGAFCSMLAKVLPLQVDLNKPERQLTVIERVLINPDGQEYLLPDPGPRRPMKQIN